MKKGILALILLLLSTIMTDKVYAGTLNTYEAEIVETAKGQYEYNGVMYQVDSVYIDQLISYLSKDDVDLTAEQRDDVIQRAFANVEQGVKEGYLKPVAGQADTTEDTLPEQENTDNDSDNADSKGTEGDTKELEKTKKQEQLEKEQVSEVEVVVDTKNVDTKKVDTKKVDAEKVDAEKVEAGKTATNTGSKQEQGTDNKVASANNQSGSDAAQTGAASADTVASGNDGNEDELTPEDLIDASLSGNSTTADLVIKNTGFNLNRTAVMAAGMGMVMLIGIIVTIKNDYFANEDE